MREAAAQLPEETEESDLIDEPDTLDEEADAEMAASAESPDDE